MSNLIISIEELFYNLFKDVGVSFSGSYTSRDKEMDQIKKDVLYSPPPSIREDRINLKKDASNVASDYKKAYLSKKAEYSK